MLTKNYAVVAFFSAILFSFLAAQAFFGATQIGIGSDEHTHMDRTATWFSTGWFVPDRFLDANGEPRGDLAPGRAHLYGGAYSILAHIVNVAAGNETLGQPEHTIAAYTGRKLVTAALGVATALVGAWAVRVLTGSLTAGVWTSAAILAVPAWTGYSMFHPKDVAVAAGMTFFTAGLAIALHPSGGRMRGAAIAILCFVGMYFGFGTRIAMWVPIAAIFAVFTLLYLLSSSRPEIKQRLAVAAVSTAAGFLLVATMHYRSAAMPYEWLIRAVLFTSEFPHNSTTLTAGVQVPSRDPIWWYIPAWVFTAIPIGILVLALLGTVLLIVRGPIKGFLISRLAHEQAGFLLFAQQATMLPVVVILTGSSAYAGVRHHLYTLPALAILAGLGAYWLLSSSPTRLRWLAVVGLIAAIVVPAVEQTRLFPYNYVYRNLLAGQVSGRWEEDLHWVSGREGVHQVPAGQHVFCYHHGQGRQAECSASQRHRLHTFLSELGQNSVVADSAAAADWVVSRRASGSSPHCEVVGKVARPLRTETLVLTQILICANHTADAAAGSEDVDEDLTID